MINNYFFTVKLIGCGIGETGAVSMSDALRMNTSLTSIDLDGEYKMRHANTQVCNLLDSVPTNQQATRLEKEE